RDPVLDPRGADGAHGAHDSQAQMMTMTLDRLRPALLESPRGRPWREALAGRAVTVVGLARSGVAACRLLRALGARVTGTDARAAAALYPEARALGAEGVRLVVDGHPPEAFAAAQLVVLRPPPPPPHPPPPPSPTRRPPPLPERRRCRPAAGSTPRTGR